MNENISRHLAGSKVDLEKVDKETRDIILAHKHSIHNYPDIKKDNICGCFYCAKVFKPSEIVDRTVEPTGKDTAICPYCGIDSVIGDSSGYPITEEFLEKMYEYWFNN